MTHWSKGPNAEATRAKLSAALKGLTFSPEVIARRVATYKARLARQGGLHPEHMAKLRAGAQPYYDARRHPDRICPVCMRPFHPNARTQTFCSRSCSDQPGAKRRAPRPGASGANHHNWQGGITPVNHAIRTSLEYAIWRDAVFARDDHTCVRCDKRGGDMHADHIQPFATHPELRFEVANGRTLCPPCHRVHGANPRRITVEESRGH